jgi:transposase
MDQSGLFTAALGLTAPWQVERVEFDQARGRLDLSLVFPRGSRFPCPAKDCAQRDCAIHDTTEKTWRHMDFFQHRAFLHARLPRVSCPTHGVRQVAVPWARAGSGFTLLFEALLLQFAAAMPVRTVAGMVGEHDTRIWRVLDHHVSAARAVADHSQVTRVGMDETAAARGQDYVSIFADMDRRRVLFATEGRDGDTVARFAADLRAHGGDPGAVTDTSSDMSAAYIAGIGEHLPNAAMTFDRFHVMAKLSEAVDAVRRDEVTARPELKGTRWLWLKNRTNLTARQQGELFALTRPSARLATARALRWREDFQAYYDQPDDWAEHYLRRWCYGAKRSRLQPIKDFVATVERNWDGITAWHASRLNNGLLEGINSLVQAAKARARGYRNKRNMITIIYLTAAKLPLPTVADPAPAYARAAA